MMKAESWEVYGALRRHSRWIALACLTAMAPVAIGCYGKFPLTHAVYNFNGKIGGEFEDEKLGEVAQSGVMWVFIIIPVYGLAALGDILIFNLVEFWTGDNLLEVSSATRPDGSTVALTPSADGKSATYSVTKDGKVVQEQQMVRLSDTTTEIRGASGDLQGVVVKTASGDLELRNAKGAVVKTIPAEKIAM